MSATRLSCACSLAVITAALLAGCVSVGTAASASPKSVDAASVDAKSKANTQGKCAEGQTSTAAAPCTKDRPNK